MKYTITSRTRSRGRVGIHRSPIGSGGSPVVNGIGVTSGYKRRRFHWRARRDSLTLKAGSPVPSQVAQVGRNGIPGSSGRSVSSELLANLVFSAPTSTSTLRECSRLCLFLVLILRLASSESSPAMTGEMYGVIPGEKYAKCPA